MPAPTKIRFAILGFGLHAEKRLVPAFPACHSATLTGLWRRDQTAAHKSAATHHIESFPTRESLCASPNVDAIFITSPDALHLDDCLLAIAHRKPILCEKPLAMNAAEARTILAAAQAANLPFGVAQNFRFNHSLEYIQQQVASGLIGIPQQARAEFAYPATASARKWITDPTLATGGPIADVGVHCIDALRFALAAEVLTISTLAHYEPSENVEAYATLQLSMSQNIQATITSNGRSPYRSLIEIQGTTGLLTSENCLAVDRPVEVHLRRGGDVVETRTFHNEDGYTRMLDAFAHHLQHQTPFTPTGEDALKNMQALDAAYRSIKSKISEPA